LRYVIKATVSVSTASAAMARVAKRRINGMSRELSVMNSGDGA
jgi:hypothetical protein